MSPTARAVLLLAITAPLALLIGIVAPQLWGIGLLLIIAGLGLIALDIARSVRRDHVIISPAPLDALYIGSSDTLRLDLSFAGGKPPPSFEAKLETGDLINHQQLPSDTGVAYELRPVRRGMGHVHALWLRWRGPFGLIWRQTRYPLDIDIPITPDLRSVKQHALKMFSRDAFFGSKVDMERGEGSEFDALRDFTTGMDKRSIDWKQSARHRKLIAKEYRIERNHPIYFAFDTGRLMNQPVAGTARIDHAINAALIMAYVSLKMGDRVGLYAFDDRPRLATKAVSGAAAFPLIQRRAAEIDYSTADTNFTLGLLRLSERLDRRSLIILFTDFADTTSAELMLENLGRLLKNHLVLFVSFRDLQLEALVDAPPETPEDVTRAVVAAELLKERDLVLAKLSRMGAQIIEVEPEKLGVQLLNQYLDLHRRNML